MMRPVVLVMGGALLLAATPAQAAPTCSFDAPTATLTVTLDGTAAGVITRTVSGQIRLNGSNCTGATVDTTDTVQVNGGEPADSVTVTGTFAPGATPEGDGNSEIEFVFALGVGVDTVRLNFTSNAETIPFTAGGIDIGGDLDQDMTTSGTEMLKVYALGGADTVDASAYAGGGKLFIYGGDGNDVITGSDQLDSLYGDADNDTITGEAGNDHIWGGTGDDLVDGGEGNDVFTAEATADGNDSYYGGNGRDTITYGQRTVGVDVTLGNGLADDGEPGSETDFTDEFIENLTGGAGADVLDGTAAGNTIKGGGGADEIYGEDGKDNLQGGDGNDILVGDAGNDTLYGEGGSDSLDGGDGADTLYGGVGSDTLTGGPGTDHFFGEAGNDVFFNGDNIAEQVDCGTGTADDAQPDILDTFISCEL